MKTPLPKASAGSFRPDTDDNLLTTAEAAKILGIAEKTLAEWRGQGKGPSCVKMGRTIRYQRSAVQSFIDSSRVEPLVAAQTAASTTKAPPTGTKKEKSKATKGKNGQNRSISTKTNKDRSTPVKKAKNITKSVSSKGKFPAR